jgi:hypothetical protein
MTARELNRAVARATGETAATIARLGFSFLMDEPVDDDFADSAAADGGLGRLGRSACGVPRLKLKTHSKVRLVASAACGLARAAI